MTERLYYTDSYRTEFDAAVVDRSDDGMRVYLDRTAFYPTSGGQPFDMGTIEGVPVADVVDEGDRIAHLLAAPVSTTRIVGRVDWSRRFDHMQQHTGQHLLSAVFADLFQLNTVSVHFGAESSTLDLDGDSVPPDRVSKAENRANALVFENRIVRVSFEDAAAAVGLRKATEREGTVRVVTIDKLDRSACGGTHVRSTGEIGPILIRKVERVKRHSRVEFLCGHRAVRQARGDYDILTRLAAALSASPEELPDLTARQRMELKEVTASRRELEQRLNGYEARELYHAATPEASGVRRIVQQQEAGSLERLRGLAQAITALPGAMYIGTIQQPPMILIASSADSGIDAAITLKAALTTVGGRGGGSARVAQGTVANPAALAKVLEALDKAR